MRGAAILAILAIVLSTAAPAQQVDPERLRVNIDATFLNDYGQPVDGVTVKLISEDGSRRYEATSTSEGKLAFEDVRPGKYLVQLESAGYTWVNASDKTGGITVEVKPDGTLEPDLLQATRKKMVKGGMWVEILIFLGILGAGAAAAV